MGLSILRTDFLNSLLGVALTAFAQVLQRPWCPSVDSLDNEKACPISFHSSQAKQSFC
jgi:hypothetical protein